MLAAMLYDNSYVHMLSSWPSLGLWVGWVGLSGTPVEAVEDDSRTAVVAVTTAGTDRSHAVREIVHAYERSGDSALTGLPELPAGIVVDRAGGRCVLFNDRYGRDRLYLYAAGGRLLFSSEAKAILAAAPETRSFDPTGLAELLACGCTLGARSLFRDIEVIPGGTLLTVEGRAVRRRRYFDPAQLEQLEPVSASEFVEGFSRSLLDAVGKATHASDVGVSLTGGLDSRMLMASLDAAAGEVPCYTFGSMYRTTADVAVARQVAAVCGQPHRVIALGAEFLAHAAEYLDEAVYTSDGYLGLSGAAELYCNRLARAMAPCRMTGNWGGELMRGVRAFKYSLPKGDFIRPEIVTRLLESTAAFSAPGSHPLSAALFQQVPHQGYGRNAIERSQLQLCSPFLDPDVVQWLYRAPSGARDAAATAAAVIARRPKLLDIPTDAGLLGARPSRWRRGWRRAVVKAEYLTSHGAPDWLAKLSSALPPGVLEARFLGVDKFHHFRYWIRRDLAGLVRDTLLGQCRDELASWFDMSQVARMVDDHIGGRANHTDAIDKLMTVAVAGRRLLRPPARTTGTTVRQPELVR
jgi:asparagine synthase (glutamine-hydrolysing)